MRSRRPRVDGGTARRRQHQVEVRLEAERHRSATPRTDQPRFVAPGRAEQLPAPRRAQGGVHGIALSRQGCAVLVVSVERRTLRDEVLFHLRVKRLDSPKHFTNAACYFGCTEHI